MMTAISGVMLAAGSPLAALIVVKVTIVAALGLAATWLARRSRAAVRHALLTVTFGATLVLPIASIVAPPVHITVPVAEVSRSAWPLVVNTTAPIPPVTTAADGARVAPAAPQQSSFSLSALLLAGWIVGTAVFLVPVMTGLWQIRSLRRSGLPWLDGQSIAETLALDAGIHRRVEVLLHEALPGPITCGVLGPAIVLPRDAENWAREDLSRAIVHELEHVRRGDSATRCLARAVCALYWFHPLTWIAWRKLVLEAERSCDDAVLRLSEATAYADQLVGLAKRLPTAQRSLLAMASRSDLSARVGAVLDSRQNRGRAGAGAVMLASAVAVALVITMSPLMLVAAPQAAPAATPKFEVASIRRCGGADSVDGGRGGGARFSAERLTLNCQSVYGLIQAAYVIFVNGHLNPPWSVSIEGSPAWINSTSYDINAKSEGVASPDMMEGPMLQALLEDRFKLKVHRETREVSVYALTVAKGGLKLQQWQEGSCTLIDHMNPLPPPDFTKPAPPPPPKGTKPYCGGRWGRKGSNVTWDVQGTTLDELSENLGARLDRPIINRTEITGRFDLHLEFGPDQATPRLLAAAGNLDDPSGGPSIFSAVQQQLGLKLDPAKGPGAFLVIDHVERPTEN